MATKLTHAARIADPTNDALGWVRYHKSDRNLLNVGKAGLGTGRKNTLAKRVTTRALTDCVATRADGSTYIVRNHSKGAPTIVKVTPPNPRVNIARRHAKRRLTDYVAFADAHGFDPTSWANAYRQRDANGYGYIDSIATVEVTLSDTWGRKS